jgi:uncharacterized protein (TIGR02466 family)
MIIGSIIHEYTLDDHVNINKSVVDYLYDLKKLDSKTDKISNIGGWQKNHLEQVPELATLSSAIFKQFEKFLVEELGPNVELSVFLGNLFCNINPPGSYHLGHIHDGHFTGVYYLNTPENCGNLVIQNPQQDPVSAEMSRYFQNINLDTNIVPVSGTGYFFPSHLVHSVDENVSNEDRISLSYNIRVFPKNDM